MVKNSCTEHVTNACIKNFTLIFWSFSVAAYAIVFLLFIGVNGIVNNGDTGFPLDAVQRFFDTISAWNSRIDFGIPQYLAHNTIPLDFLRTIPAVLGLTMQQQSQLFFIFVFVAIAIAGERFASLGLELRNPMARILTAASLLFNPFNTDQILGGQGLQLLQYAGLIACITMLLILQKKWEWGKVCLCILFSMFSGLVFFPFLIGVYVLILLNTFFLSKKYCKNFIFLFFIMIFANMYWILPLAARTHSMPITSEIFKNNSADLVLDATKPFTGLEWITRLMFGHHPVGTPYIAFLTSSWGLLLGFFSIFLVLISLFTKHKLVWSFAIIWIISSILATGIHYNFFAPIYIWCFTHIPLFSAYRVPVKFLVLTIISQSALIGICLDWLLGKKKQDFPFKGISFLLITIYLTSLYMTGGIFFIKSISSEINLSHYPQDYFIKQPPLKDKKFIELLPSSVYGGYIPTIDTTYSIIRSYYPQVNSWDTMVINAIENRTWQTFLASYGLYGWLVHNDIPGTEKIIKTLNINSTKALTVKFGNQNVAPLITWYTSSYYHSLLSENTTSLRWWKYEKNIQFIKHNDSLYTISNAPDKGLIMLRQHDDPWWYAVDSKGNKLRKLGEAYYHFPVWQLNGSTHISIIYMGQTYLYLGLLLSSFTWSILFFTYIFTKHTNNKT